MGTVINKKVFLLPIICMLFIAVFFGCGSDTEDSGSHVPFPGDIYHLTARDAPTEAFFGISVSISGDYAIVGAVGDDGGLDDTVALAGAAYTFHRTGPQTLIMKIKG